MMMIRALVKDDVDQIMIFLLGKNEVSWSSKTLKAVLEGMLEGRYLASVGVDESTSQVVSYAVASYAFDQADLQNVVVDQSFRGCGFGRQLLQGLIEDLVNRQVSTVFLEVRQSNQVAISLYQSMGFECIQKRRNYYPGVGGVREDALVFSLACL